MQKDVDACKAFIKERPSCPLKNVSLDEEGVQFLLEGGLRVSCMILDRDRRVGESGFSGVGIG